jgi:hypothetical protein
MPRPARALHKGDPPNARSDKDGRFTLYVGWYAAANEVAVSIPGYTTLTTNLGPRPLGAHRLNRDFRLQPGQNTNHLVIEYDRNSRCACIQLSRSSSAERDVRPPIGTRQEQLGRQIGSSNRGYLRWQDVCAEARSTCC